MSPYRSARRYAREIASPDLRAWHGVVDPRSWATAAAIWRRLHPTPTEVRRVVALATAGRDGGRYLATLPRSGTNWLSTLLDSAHSRSLGLDGDYDYLPDYWPTGDPGWAPRGQRLVWPVAALSLTKAVQIARDRPLPELPVLGSHYPLTRGIHPLDRGGRPVVLVRHPTPAIRSLVHMRQNGDAEARRGRLVKLAREYVRFFDHWSSAIDADHDGRILLVRYEELTDDPAAALARISGHWSMDLPSTAITDAVDLCAMSRMADKAGDDPANTRVRVATPPQIDPDLVAQLDRIISEELTATLGYDRDADDATSSSSPTSAISRSDDRPST